MNILLLNYEFPPIGGGGGAVCGDLVQQLRTSGHDVEVVTMAYKDLPRYEEIKGVKIHRVRCLRKNDRVCHPWEQLTYCINAYFYILKNIDMRSVDIINAHFIIPTGLLGMWLKRKYGTKLVVTAHGSDVLGHNNSRFGFAYKIVKPLWNKIVRKADIVTAPSQYLYNKILANVSVCNCLILPNGIHVDKYKALEKKKSILVLTRLQESKGVQDLINAVSTMDLKDWEINILGDGPYRQELEKLTGDLHLESVVKFRGHTIGKEKMKYLGEAAVYFSGSRFEAFPISVLEATLTGCNIIASDIEPHRMLVGETHIYHSQNELISLVQETIDKNPEEYVYDTRKYDWHIVGQKYIDLFNNVISEDKN